MKTKFSVPVVCAFLLLSCSKEISERTKPQNDLNELSDKDGIKAKLVFAKILAKAVTNEEIRNIISTNASKEFDKDYDVLYHRVKNEKILDSTFYSYIKNNSSEIEYEMINNDALLNIYVPKNQNVDNIEKIKNQVPLVAVRNADDKLIAYNSNGQIKELDPNTLPNFPVIVVKDNERVVAISKDNSKELKNNLGNYIFSTDKNNFYYTNNEYNPNVSFRGIVASNLDSEILKAYNQNLNCNTCYQRDWIYYNIYPAGGQNEGGLNRQYAEAITGIAFTNTDVFSTIGGWDEGKYELQIRSFYGGRSEGVFSSDLKVISVDPEKMFLFDSDNRPIAPIQYNPSYITYTAWDMNYYGDRWAFSIEEFDPSKTTNRSYTHTTTFGANYKVTGDVNVKIVKIGTEFNGSITNTKSNTFNVETTEGSDQLGTGVMTWTDPIITTIKSKIPLVNLRNVAFTKEINTGSVLLSVEPVKIQ